MDKKHITSASGDRQTDMTNNKHSSIILDTVKRFFRQFFFIMGVMVMPILVLDLLVRQDSYVMLWWGMLFSAALAAFDMIFSCIPIFNEKIMLKRTVFFFLLTAVAIGSSYIMGILTTLPVILAGIAGCSIVGVPLLVWLAYSERKKAKQLNDLLSEYNGIPDGLPDTKNDRIA